MNIFPVSGCEFQSDSAMMSGRWLARQRRRGVTMPSTTIFVDSAQNLEKNLWKFVKCVYVYFFTSSIHVPASLTLPGTQNKLFMLVQRHGQVKKKKIVLVYVRLHHNYILSLSRSWKLYFGCANVSYAHTPFFWTYATYGIVVCAPTPDLKGFCKKKKKGVHIQHQACLQSRAFGPGPGS